MTTYTPESLEVAIAVRVYGSHDASLDNMLISMFGDEKENIPKPLIKRVRQLYIKHQKLIVQHLGKNYIADFVKRGETNDIQHFQECIKQQQQQNLFQSLDNDSAENIQLRINHLQQIEAAQSVFKYFSRYFITQVKVFIKCDIENEFRNSLQDWIKSGEINLETWKRLNTWYQNGNKLSSFLKEDFKPSSTNDVLIKNVKKLAGKITTNEFLNPKSISALLEKTFESPKITVDNNKITVNGKVVYLDEKFVQEILDHLKNAEKEIMQIEVYASYFCALCTDLLFYEKNLVISTSKLRIWNKCCINLSGRSYKPLERKAKNAENSMEDGTKGADGKPGGSSGNLTILTRFIVESELLQVFLNGGRGEDGENGGDGYKGNDGKGVTAEEIDGSFRHYTSLYWNSWPTFENYNPGDNWKEEIYENSRYYKYAYKKFTDADNRVLHYSYAGISVCRFWPCIHLYTAKTYRYDSFIHIIGAPGEKGTKGGTNGVGGEGGYRGECLVMNPETMEKFSINVTRNTGENGKNADCGKPGSNGKKGNDRAIIDSSLGYRCELGDDEHTLKTERYSWTGDSRRYCGYEKYCKDEPYPWVKFVNDETCQSSLVSLTASQNQYTKAVAQSAVMTENVMNKSAELFDDESAFVEEVSLEFEDVDEDEEEEETEEQTVEQVMVLRQSGDTKITEYTTESLKTIIPKPTPQSLIKDIKKSGCFGVVTSAAQNLFDLFTLEMDSKQLESIRFPTLFQKNHFVHAVGDKSVPLTLIALRQCHIQNGKTYEEILDFATTVALRRKLKFEMTRYQGEHSNSVINFLTSDITVDESIKPTEILEGVRKSSQLEVSQESVFKLIKNVISHQETYYIPNEELISLHVFIQTLPLDLKQSIDEFNQPQIVWSNGDGEKLLMKLFEILVKKQKIAESHDADFSEAEPPNQSSPKDDENNSPSINLVITDETKTKFQNLVKKINSNVDAILPGIVPFQHYFEKNKESIQRYREQLPELLFSKNKQTHKNDRWFNKLGSKASAFLFKDVGKSVEATLFVMKAYFIAQEVLPFNRKLYNCNWLVNCDNDKVKNRKTFVNDVDDPNFTNFIQQLRQQPFDVTSDYCSREMKSKGINSSAVQYIYCLENNKNIASYVSVGHQNLQRQYFFKSANPQISKTEFIWIDKDVAYNIEVDKDYRIFVEAQRILADKEKSAVDKILDTGINIPDLTTFYQSELQKNVKQWMESYFVVTQFEQLLQFLCARFFIDGCHLSLFELQFTLSTFSHLHTKYRINLHFVLTLLASASQTNFVNILLFIRLCYRYEKRLELKSKIWKGIQLIDNVRLKIVFGIKLADYDNSIEMDMLYKIILMLQHASTGSEKLENLTMAMWIEIAQKQTWSEISSVLKEFGKAGYYLGVLDSKGFLREQKMMSEVLRSVKYVPENDLAKFTFMLCNREFEENKVEINIKKFKKWLQKKNNWKCDAIAHSEKHATLITDEILQKEFISYHNTSQMEFDAEDDMDSDDENKNIPEDELDSQPESEDYDIEAADIIFDNSAEVYESDDNTEPESDSYDIENDMDSDNENIEDIEDDNNSVNKVSKKTKSEMLCFDICRKIDDLKRLVVGQHDQTPEEKAKRQETVAKYCTYLEQLENNAAPTEACKLLLEFDKYLENLFKKKLRITQKMAVLCAVEAQEPVLEQVHTGEGKSFIIAAIAIIRCIRDKQTVDIITSSPVLAERDAKELEPLYAKFKLRVGHNCSESIIERQRAYSDDIVYGDISRFQRDYLMQTFYKKTILGSRIRDVVIVDEVDNMLLDNGNNILYLSHDVPCLNILESLFVYILREVHSPIFNGQQNSMEHMQSQYETDIIVANVLEQIYGKFSLEDAHCCMSNNKELAKQIHSLVVKNNIIDADGYLLSPSKAQIQALHVQLKAISASEVHNQRVIAALTIAADKKCEFALPTFLRPFVKLHLHEFIENCKKSMLMDEEYEYVVDIDRTDSGKQIEPVVTIVDSNTGADLPTTQWNGGLHQFLQLKHGCRLSPLSLKAVFVSNVAYLKGYKVINGLSGTLGSIHESKTLIELYGADLIRIPTFKPKQFCEHAPVLVTNVTEWTKSIYNEINDQILIGRSLLIICDSIAQAKQLHKNLMNTYKEETDPSDLQKECFENIATYLRSCDEFDFEKGKELQPGHIILATNLAGRGTDIKLNKELVQNGGLHVIIAFMPKNARIEEQAFGRAARAGQPGSAEIIALIKEKNGVTPSIFQFKMYRDNIEVQRLTELKVFYDYHTEIEERCLEKFRSHCADVLSEVYSSKANDNASILRPDEVVYFALLDKWAMWLDEKGPLINQCAKNNNEDERIRQKEAIINSVDLFLTIHELDLETAQNSWLDFPQSLLTLGLYSLCHKDFSKADKLFDRVIEQDFQFAAEAYYYKACIRIPSYNNPEGNHINKNEAEKLFHFARTLFSYRLADYKKESATVMKFINGTSKGAITSSGFEKQHNLMEKYITGVVNNIDWIIGAPCTPDMFVCQNIDIVNSQNLYHKFLSHTVIAPMLYVNYKPESWMLRNLHDVYGMSNTEITSSIYEFKQDMLTYFREPDIEEITKDNIPDKNDNNAFRLATISVLPDRIHLSNRQSFFTELYENGVLRKVIHLRYADPNHVTEVENAMKKTDVKPIELPQKGHFVTLNNSVKEDRVYYNSDDIDSLQNPDIQNKMLDEFIGEVFLESLKCFLYFTKFDGVTAIELAEYFEIDIAGAAWILQTLQDNSILEHVMEQRTRFTVHNQLWTDKVEIYLKDSDEENNDESQTEVTLIQKYSRQLQNMRSIKDLQHLTVSVIQKVCDIEDDETLKNLYDTLKKEGLIEDYLFAIFRLNNRLDVSCLPKSIANSVDFYLSNKFAYSFALERLCIDIDTSDVNPESAVFHYIYLPEYPYKQYFNDLQTCGFITPPRIVTRNFEELDEDSFNYIQDILATIRKYKTKLIDETQHHLDFVPLEKYITNQSIPIHTELKYLSDRGLKIVMGVAEGNVSWTAFITVVGGVRDAVKMVIKSVSTFFGWFAGIASKVGNWISDNVMTPVAKVIGSGYKAIKTAVIAVTNTIVNSQAFKLVTDCVKGVVSAVVKIANGIASVIKPVTDVLYEFGEMTGINAGVRLIARGAAVIGNKLKDMACEGIKRIYNSAKELITDPLGFIAKMPVINQAVNITMNIAKYVYRKMSPLIKAALESYDYYNECRVYARKIALNEGLQVDEYTILRSYIDARNSAGEEDTSDNIFKENIQKHLEITHEKALTRFRTDIEKYIKLELSAYNVHTSKDDLNTIKWFVEVSPSVLAFKKELEEKYTIESHKAKIVFVHLTTEFAKHNAPFESMEMPDLESNFSFDRLEGIVRKIVIDYASHVDMQKAEDNQTSSESFLLTKVLTDLLIEKVSNSCRIIYATSPTAELLDFVAQLRNAGEVPELAEFDREDKMLKYGLSQYNAQVAQKKQNHAVLREIVRSMQATIDNREVLKTAIKYGFPLPVDSLKLIQPSLNKVISKPLRITVKGKPNYGRPGGMLLTMDHIDECIFVTNGDYLRYKNVGEHAGDNFVNAFLFEGILKAGISEIAGDHEAFRQSLIQAL